MVKAKLDKSRVLAIAALVLLWVTHGMFIYLELDSMFAIWRYALEGGICVLITAFCLLQMPPVVGLASAAAGTIALCIVYSRSEATSMLRQFAPLLYFFVFIFLFGQSAPLFNNKNRVWKSFCTGLEYFSPILLLGMIVFAGVKGTPSFSTDWAYCILVSVLVAAVYVWISRTKVSKSGNAKGKENRAQQLGAMQWSFVLASVVIVESSVYCCLNQFQILAHMLPLLWVVNLLVLFEQKHPLVFAFGEKMQFKLKGFLTGEKV